MHIKFPIHTYSTFDALPFDALNRLRFSVFVIDYDWNYLFVNTCGLERLEGIEPVGKQVHNIWKEHPLINFEPIYDSLKRPVANREVFDTKTISPITKKGIHLSGYPMSDCYYFSVSELPDKEDLIAELRGIIKNR